MTSSEIFIVLFILMHWKGWMHVLPNKNPHLGTWRARARERERERERERYRHTDRQPGRQTDRQACKQADRQTDRQNKIYITQQPREVQVMCVCWGVGVGGEGGVSAK